jgi:FkbM family methyltransferase
MRWIRAKGVGAGRASRVAAFEVVLCATVMSFAALGGCDRSAEPALAPQLLCDTDEIAAYLDQFPTGDYQIAEVPGLGRFYVDDNPSRVKKTLLSGKPWEPYVVEEMAKHVASGDTVLDIGAHIGSLTVPMARLVGEKGKVYAFEPQRKIFRELIHNLKLNELTNAVPLRFALSSETGVVWMRGAISDGQAFVGKRGDVVEARTIDSFGFSDVSLIKVDVEGHEAEVLQGAEKTIGALHPVIIVEIWKRNREVIIPILTGYGYSVRLITSSRDDYVATYEPKP